MLKNNKRYVIWAAIGLIIVSLLASLYMDIYRFNSESTYNSVEILLDYDELAVLADARHEPLRIIAEKFRAAGATGVIMRERTLDDLQRSGDVYILDGSDVGFIKTINNNAYADIQVEKNKSYILINNEETYQTVAINLEIKGKEFKVIKTEEYNIIVLPLTQKELTKLGVGFTQKDLQAINDAGLTLVPRIRFWQGADQKTLDMFFASIKDIPAVSMLTFNDPVIFATGNIPYIAEKIKELNVPVGSFEFYEQQGLNSLALQSGKKVQRVHAISENDMEKYNESQAIDRFNLAVSERNIRVLMVRLFGMSQPEKAYDRALKYLEDIKTNIEKEGFNIGSAKDLPGLPYSRLIMFVIGLGVIGGGILIATQIFNSFWAALLGILAIVGWGGLLFIQPVLARKAFALFSVIIFPVIGVTSVVSDKKKRLNEAVYALLKMSLISFIGAVIMTGLLADKSFMIKLDQFSGVKAAHVIPLLIIVVYYVFKDSKYMDKFKEILNLPILMWHVIAGGLLLVVLAVYVIRTGNTGTMLVSSWEITMREFLDKLLGVRPRTKEFLLGHPAMLALLYYGYDLRRVLLLILGVIGQVSLVNTYAHIHTPLLISLIRSFHGLWIGILIGIALVLVMGVSLNWLKRRGLTGE